jgi:hypothetical protein
VEKTREVANAFSHQAYRLDRASPTILEAAGRRLGQAQATDGLAVLMAKQAEFGHMLVESYRSGRYRPMAALVRTLLEDTSYLAWVATPGDPEKQTRRMLRGVLAFYRAAEQNGVKLPPAAKTLVRETTGKAARKPPSFEDRLRQLDKHEEETGGEQFWRSHAGQIAVSNDHVHTTMAGPMFGISKAHELLGFSTLAYGHQYLTLGAVSAARVAGLDQMAERFTEAYRRVVDLQRRQLGKLTAR